MRLERIPALCWMRVVQLHLGTLSFWPQKQAEVNAPSCCNLVLLLCEEQAKHWRTLEPGFSTWRKPCLVCLILGPGPADLGHGSLKHPRNRNRVICLCHAFPSVLNGAVQPSGLADCTLDPADHPDAFATQLRALQAKAQLRESPK